ncbi:L-threonine ammonia-lyase [Corynebacterium epidermidicanis]|uniref:L-threonine dehydratase n=2 Tax=Corynebacterium epidermidicanis TaxID=1050174 RepID=A0A0G3GQL9_9CORY|nr:L-threonine ammonia-lyase [Corynebacterium epidermidicanis]
MVKASDIQAAQARISAIIAPTPLQYCPRLSQATGAQVYLKREDLQDVRSYKIRGAYNAMIQLDPARVDAGIVTASAGNHAQGVAYACRTLGIQGRIFVPKKTPKQKLSRITVHGGEHVDVELVGNNFDEAAAAARAYATEHGATFIQPFDAWDTVAGQGTVAAEILAQLASMGKHPARVYVPVGGGGLLGGILSYLRDISPQTQVVAAEPAGASSMQAALAAGHPVAVPHLDPFVDGAAVGKVGEFTYQIADANRDRLTTVSIDEGAVCTEMLELYQNEGIVAEPAGALSVAALVDSPPQPDEVVVCIISGGNNDVLRYNEIVERSLVHQGLKHYFLVNFPQEPGQLRSFLSDVLGPDDDITLFEYLKRNNRETGAALVGIQLGQAGDLPALLARMEESQISCQQLQPGTPEYEFLT